MYKKNKKWLLTWSMFVSLFMWLYTTEVNAAVDAGESCDNSPPSTCIPQSNPGDPKCFNYSTGTATDWNWSLLASNCNNLADGTKVWCCEDPAPVLPMEGQSCRIADGGCASPFVCKLNGWTSLADRKCYDATKVYVSGNDAFSLGCTTTSGRSEGNTCYTNTNTLGGVLGTCVSTGDGGRLTCTANNTPVDIATRIDGVCGASNGQTLTSKPINGLCSAGNYDSVIGTGPWTWKCLGTNGGTTVNCSTNVSTGTGSTGTGSTGTGTQIVTPGTTVGGSGVATGGESSIPAVPLTVVTPPPVVGPSLPAISSGSLSNKSIEAIITNIVSWMLGIFGTVAIGAFVFAGFQYLLAGGSSTGTETAKKHMLWSIVGVLVAASGLIIIQAVQAMLNVQTVF